MNRGKFIVLEGLDRSGKSSLARYLQDKLGKERTQLIGFPDRNTTIGKMINEHLSSQVDLSHQVIHLLFSANRWEKVSFIETVLKNGKNIVCDRYWYSGVAYSVAKGLDYEWCISTDKRLVEPNLIIYLQGSPEQLSKRGGYGQQRFQKLQFQTKVAEVFNRLFINSTNNNVALLPVCDRTLHQLQVQLDKILVKHFDNT